MEDFLAMFLDLLTNASGFLTLFEASPKMKARKLAYNAFLDVFDKDRLTRFLKLELDKKLDAITTAGNLRDIIFAVVVQAEKEGWLVDLITKAKNEFPGNTPFVASCDQALNWLEIDRQKQTKGEKAPPAARRWNLILIVTFLVLVITWGLVLFGWTTVWYVVWAIGAWLTTNVLQFVFESEKLRKIDEFLRVVLDSPRTTYYLSGLLALGVLASLFVGSVQAPPKDDKFEVRIERLSNYHIGRSLEAGKARAYTTTLWSRREVTVWADGYQPRPVEVWPWWRERLRAEDKGFRLAPYVLLAAPNWLLDSNAITQTNKGKLDIDVAGCVQTVDEYMGELVLLGDSRHDLPPWVDTALKVTEKVSKQDDKYYSVSRTNTWKDGKPTQVFCPENWQSGAKVTIRVLTRVPLDAGGFRFQPEPRAETTLTIHDPEQQTSAVLKVQLLQKE
jgi:hypothetical protein